MNFPAPTDQYVIPGIGTVYATALQEDHRRTEFEAWAGQTVELGGRPFRVRGVESRCVETQHKGWPIGLLGEYVEPELG